MVDVSIDFDVFLSVAVGRGGGRASYLHEKVEGVEKGVSRIFLDILRKFEDSWHLRRTSVKRETNIPLFQNSWIMENDWGIYLYLKDNLKEE